MFYKYEIKSNGEQDILYLYLRMTYEFSRELALESNDEELSRRTRNFIKNNNINYDGDKVYLVIDGIIVKTLNIKDYSDPIEILKENLYFSNEHFLLTIKMNDGALIELPLEEYLLGVLATNTYLDLDIEVLKAITILYRSYAFFRMSSEKVIDAYNDFALYKPISYYKLVWGGHYEERVSKLKEAIKDTDCLFITYENKYVLPFIHFSNIGRTFSHRNYPYLSSVRSLWDLASPYYIEVKDFSYDDLSLALKVEVKPTSQMHILEIDNRDYVKKISIARKVFTGEEFKKLLNLKSMNINIIVNKDTFRVVTKGFGNGYGLSVFGANQLAKNGCDYANILKYYFPKAKINKYIKELS